MLKNLKKLFVTLAGCLALLCSCSPFNPSGDTYTVNLNKTELTLDVDKGAQLAVKSVVHNDKFVTAYTLRWTSSNTSVATVSSNGYVTAKMLGNAEITANVTIAGILKTYAAKCMVSVTDSNPVSIKLNKTNTNVQIGKNVQLTATIEHSLNKGVTWESTSEFIVVDKNGLVSAKEGTPEGHTAVITATSVADPNVKAICNVKAVEKKISNLDYTLMFYMCGSTLENERKSGSAYPALFSEDITEMLSVDLPDSVKIIIETGGSTKWGLSSSYIDGAKSISNTALQRWEIVDHKIKLIETLDTNKMALQSSFESFVEWGINDYDADQMGVIISGHGAGIGGCAVDDNYTYVDGRYEVEHTLNTTEISTAIKNVLKNTNHDKLTWIGFDCCLMSCADNASIFADYFNYMVASQEEEMGEGWDHDNYMNLFMEDPNVAPEVLLPKICSTFVKSGHDEYCVSRDPCYQTLSVLDLSKMDTFTNAFNKLVDATGTNSSQYNKYVSAFKKSYNSFGEGIYGLVDFKDYLNNITTQFSTVSTQEVLNALDDLVIANSYCSRYSTKPCGLNAFLPYSTDKEYDVQVSRADYEGEQATKFTAYQQMCLTYGTFYD